MVASSRPAWEVAEPMTEEAINEDPTMQFSNRRLRRFIITMMQIDTEGAGNTRLRHAACHCLYARTSVPGQYGGHSERQDVKGTLRHILFQKILSPTDSVLPRRVSVSEVIFCDINIDLGWYVAAA